MQIKILLHFYKLALKFIKKHIKRKIQKIKRYYLNMLKRLSLNFNFFQ